MSIGALRSSSPRTRAGLYAVLGLTAFVAAGPAAAVAASAGPFGPFIGNWQGRGTITSTNGSQEPITCRATYEGGDGDRSLTQTLVCASDSFRLNIQSNAVAQGGSLQGQWQETTRNVQGQLSGDISRGDYEGMVTGPGFTAQISLRAAGKRQAVRIQPSAGDIQNVEITLTKRR